ncbi:holo-ACP synthase [Aliidiomarina halalkaliphila]|uniref:Holo-[acyl-carrier-protein] synthase n=1 Tax=Aliidiomarina halalkaliphila TaxID=2593535 RepID=A0A552X3I6_9GAMM|nr:holo-ACP synthase [Aliidiomarina halalkaliphila]TRW49604.1 holo-ACP synthase [Aliidiomarina halalkaliphila]
MAILGIGTDIIEIARIQAALERQPGFAQRVLTTDELAEMESVRFPERFLAKRFAAKEAALKALGTGLAQGIRWQDIEIGHTESGQPTLHFSGEAENRAKQLGVLYQHISLSDEAHYAQAMVVLESA